MVQGLFKPVCLGFLPEWAGFLLPLFQLEGVSPGGG